MNCPQCQTQNGPDATFCSTCGAQLSPASTPAGAAGPGGYGTQPGYGGPAGYPPAGGPAGYPPAGGPAGYPPAGGQPPFQPGQPGQYQPGTSGGFTQRSSLPPASFDLSRLSTVDRIVAGATLVTMISLWLPWFTASYTLLGRTESSSISGTGDHGWLWIEFLLALALIAYLVARAAWDQLPFRLPLSHETLLIAATGLQFLLILIGFFAMPSTNGLDGFSIGWGFGAFLALIASIVAAAPVIYPAVRSYLNSRNAAGGTRRV
jgi:Double zinc ribbon